VLYSCKGTDNGELIGVKDIVPVYNVDPYGMTQTQQVAFILEESETDISWAVKPVTKTGTVSSFWMDDTELTNDEYRQFVYWVRDSIAKLEKGTVIDEEVYDTNKRTN
jgi:formylglycine-generating enzyme required for sulfatase activity